MVSRASELAANVVARGASEGPIVGAEAKELPIVAELDKIQTVLLQKIAAADKSIETAVKHPCRRSGGGDAARLPSSDQRKDREHHGRHQCCERGKQGLPNLDPIFTWVRPAQRIPVRIRIERVPPEVSLVAGMTCSVSVVGEKGMPVARRGRILDADPPLAVHPRKRRDIGFRVLKPTSRRLSWWTAKGQ